MKNMFFKKKKDTADHSNKRHIEIIRDIWQRKYELGGIERYIALILCAAKFLFPARRIRHHTRHMGYRARNRAIEIYMMIKVLILGYILFINHDITLRGKVIAIYILVDIVQYLLGLIFLSSVYTKLPSIKRNFAHLGMNLFEIIGSFAILYWFTGSIGGSGGVIQDGITALYFSLVTFGTIGYGDLTPIMPLGKSLVIGEILISFLFVAIIVSSFVSRLDIKNDD